MKHARDAHAIYGCKKCLCRVTAVLPGFATREEQEAAHERREKSWCVRCVLGYKLRAVAFPKNETWLRRINAVAVS